ncbi:uncharacterized protein TNCV_4734011 [Trichonephila clavipes]|nr:uncharacterized protein TNCV_4734011 [Trichonephila clavipes]
MSLQTKPPEGNLHFSGNQFVSKTVKMRDFKFKEPWCNFVLKPCTISEVSAVQIPLYNRFNPALWFIIYESTFALATPKPVTESVTRYNYVVANLTSDTASLVRDNLMHPDAMHPYAQIRKQTHKSFRGIIAARDTETSFGGRIRSRKPSELLRNMKRHVKSLNVDDKLMMELFLQRLPSSVQTILAAVSDLTLNKAVDIADRILEVSPSPIETFAVSNKKEQTLESKLFRKIEKLNERIDRISISRGGSPYRRHKTSRERSVSNKRDFSIC